MSLKKDKFTKKDYKYMSLALILANARHGLTGENPSVGCVITKNNQIISIGQTGYNGRPHAEHNAIQSCHEKLNDATMYVTLEPCNHFGKTPPCTNKIIKENIKTIIYSIDDIDKKVSGKTFKILSSKKILVKKGLLKDKMKEFYEPYIFNRKKKLPYVTGKIAISKNNLIYNNKVKKITDIYSDKFTHFLRYKNDSILISSKTLNIDNPKLNCRLKDLDRFSPVRIILDSNLSIKLNSYIFKTANKKNTVIFYNKTNKKNKLFLIKNKIHLIKSNLKKDGNFNLKVILKKLYLFGCRNLLVEGGNELTSNFLKNSLFNQFYLYKSKKTLPKTLNSKDFSSSKILLQNYNYQLKIKSKFGKDSILLYKR
jgi:diaminohydroxyphosphoribosylaminopyrimidine deaminase/5-amino-6-(5-phosphoribosylamino)uracil reductase